jgi:hypothetical protein
MCHVKKSQCKTGHKPNYSTIISMGSVKDAIDDDKNEKKMSSQFLV